MLGTDELFKLARIVDTGSFIRAASELGVTQPALSKSVARLERTLGVRLLERRARGVVATPYAVALLHRALPALAELRAAEQEIEAMRGGVGSSVVVGLAPAAAHGLLPRVIEALRQAERAISLRVSEGLAEELTQGVRTGKLDFAITTQSAGLHAPELSIQALHEDRFVVCGPVDHPLTQGSQPASPQALATVDWVLAPMGGLLRAEFDDCFLNQNATPPKALVETWSVSISKGLVKEQGFFSFLPVSVMAAEQRRGELALLKLDWLQWRRKVSLVQRRGQTLSASQRFVRGLFWDAARRP